MIRRNFKLPKEKIAVSEAEKKADEIINKQKNRILKNISVYFFNADQ
jgi:hypothetical protein